jgi:hypothetical protein
LSIWVSSYSCTVVGQFEGQLVGGVVLEHVEDETFLDGLAHGIDVEGLGHPLGVLAAKQFQGLLLGCGREGDVGQALFLTGLGGHLHGQQGFGVDFPAVLEFGQFFGREHLFQLGGGFTGLRAVGLVGDDGKALAFGGGQLLYGFQGKGEGLDGADDDLLAILECLG